MDRKCAEAPQLWNLVIAASATLAIYEREHEVTALPGDKDQTSHRHHGGSQIKLALLFRTWLVMVDSEPSSSSGYPHADPEHVTQTRVASRCN
jgi:hypothetical protein